MLVWWFGLLPGGGPEKGTKLRVFARQISVDSHPCDIRWKSFDPGFQISKRFPLLVVFIAILANLRLFGTPLVGQIPDSDNKS